MGAFGARAAAAAAAAWPQARALRATSAPPKARVTSQAGFASSYAVQHNPLAGAAV